MTMSCCNIGTIYRPVGKEEGAQRNITEEREERVKEPEEQGAFSEIAAPRNVSKVIPVKSHQHGYLTRSGQG